VRCLGQVGLWGKTGSFVKLHATVGLIDMACSGLECLRLIDSFPLQRYSPCLHALIDIRDQSGLSQCLKGWKIAVRNCLNKADIAWGFSALPTYREQARDGSAALTLEGEVKCLLMFGTVVRSGYEL